MGSKKPLYDKRGIRIYPADVLEMYHFTGARKKRYYMYKWVVEKDGRLFAHHLDKIGGTFLLSQDLLDETEIVQGHGPGDILDFLDRPRVADWAEKTAQPTTD